MAIDDLSIMLQNKIDKLIEAIEGQSKLFRIEANIRSTEDEELDIELQLIDSINIRQQFNVDYGDDIELIAQLQVADYLKLIKLSQDLYVILKFTYVDQETGEDLLDEAPTIYQYRCIIKNAKDLTQQYQLSDLIETDEDDPKNNDYESLLLDTHFQLIEELAYQLRHKKVNFILHNCNSITCLYYICQLLGISKVYIEDPDNQDTLPHYIVPPAKGLTDIFDYIQRTYGVYSKGLEYYYTDETLYIYKAYETNPESETTVNIYNVKHGSYIGFQCYHYIDPDDNNIHILSNTKVETKNLVELGVENDGNSITMLRADTILDSGWSVDNDNGLTIDSKNTVTCDLTTEKGMVKDSINSNHIGSSANIYSAASELIKNQATMAVLGWNNSVPFIIKPGHRVMYHYDDKDEYMSKTGRCESAVHTITLNTVSSEQIFQCATILMLRLEE